MTIDDAVVSVKYMYLYRRAHFSSGTHLVLSHPLFGDWCSLLPISINTSTINFEICHLTTAILLLLLLLFSLALRPSAGYGLLIHEVSWSHSDAPVGRTPLDEWSAHRGDLHLTPHNTHCRQTSMPPVRFEPTIAAGERPYTYALDRAAVDLRLRPSGRRPTP
jgi:hypothetical protein